MRFRHAPGSILMAIVFASIVPSRAEDTDKPPGQPANQLTAKEKQDGWILLFDGTLKGWTTNTREPGKSPVEDDSINPHKSGGYMMVHEKEWSDFVLSVDFKLSKGCNSGIFIRTYPLADNAAVGFNGIEIQLLDSRGTGYHDTGALYDLVKPCKNAMKPAGEWNRIVIRARDNVIDVALNGEKITHMDLNEWAQAGKRPDGSDHKFSKIAWKDHPRHGYIGFQDHGAPCWFRNVKLKPLRANHAPASIPALR